jgi:hypothetical protein
VVHLFGNGLLGFEKEVRCADQEFWSRVSYDKAKVVLEVVIVAFYEELKMRIQ